MTDETRDNITGCLCMVVILAIAIFMASCGN